MGILWRSCRTSAPMLFNCRGRRFYISAPRILLDKPTLLNCNTRISLPLSDRHSHSNASSFVSRNYAKISRKTKDLQTKRQVKEVESDDYRINGQITADPIRLVTDTGHQVVSRREALDYAKKLNLDLVEVQFNANPPVCKVMDYNLEKFNQKQREKERAKNKAEGLRKDDCREIRFTAKTEQRDLERKAEMAKQLMDRGCRVKLNLTDRPFLPFTPFGSLNNAWQWAQGNNIWKSNFSGF